MVTNPSIPQALGCALGEVDQRATLRLTSCKALVSLHLDRSAVIDMLSDLFILRGVPGISGSEAGSSLPGGARVDRRRRGKDRPHRARQPLGEWVHRELSTGYRAPAPEVFVPALAA